MSDWVYLSPILTAEHGSDHGYDVTDPSSVDPERGGPEGLLALSRAARAHGMGVLVDIVPNHVGVASPAQNPWWWSLLQEGRGSPYAAAFDVDWDLAGGKIRLPMLGSDATWTSWRSRTASSGTTTTGFRWPRAPTPTADSPQEVHGRQHYQLMDWRRADAELNYRRFFAVTTLAGIRVEDPEVFDQAHAEVRRWFAEGLVDGLRVDHPDGLADPAGYLRWLRTSAAVPTCWWRRSWSRGGPSRRLCLRGDHRLRRPGGRGPGPGGPGRRGCARHVGCGPAG